jgi:hypothetical protein
MSTKSNICGGVVPINDSAFKVKETTGEGHHSEARVLTIPYGATLVNPVVTACMSETDQVGSADVKKPKTWGFFLFCSNVTTTGFDLVVRVPLNEPDIANNSKKIKVNWIAVGD